MTDRDKYGSGIDPAYGAVNPAGRIQKMAYHVLVVEDEAPIADLLAYGLKKDGYEVSVASTGADAMTSCQKRPPDLLLLDWMLPDCSGVDLCRILTEQYNLPTIMLTARSSMEDKVSGLESGADDYITKPFELREVSARIRAVLRRVGRAHQDETPIYAGNITVYPASHEVWKDGKQAELTHMEYSLLYHLLSHPNTVFSRDRLLFELWDYNYGGDTRTVDTHIQRLRKKLDLAGSLQTVFGVGYKYVP